MASIVVVTVYLMVTSAVDLFHTESYQGVTPGPNGVNPTSVLSPNKPCPACSFLAGSNSTEISFASPLVDSQTPIVSQFAPHSTVTIVENCIHSTILLRAPPAYAIV